MWCEEDDLSKEIKAKVSCKVKIPTFQHSFIQDKPTEIYSFTSNSRKDFEERVNLINFEQIDNVYKR